MNKTSRSGIALKNVSIAGILQAFAILLNFVSRTVFVKLLGNDYLSCDGLFTNILTILSFTELGIGSAIIFSLYKPIADDDRVQIGKLMNLFATAYRIIVLVISVLGLCVIPFLRFLVRDVPDIKENITLLYILFLANTVASYIFGYKRSYLIANQENYIVLLIHHGIGVLKIVAQIVFLVLTHNYIVYLILSIAATLLTNIISTHLANKKYPWLNEYKANKLNKEERKPIFTNIFAIFQYKIGSVILNGTDNIIISLVLKTALVGLVSNYNMIISAVQTVIGQACGGLQATVGNHNVTSSNEVRYNIFKKLYFISYWGFGLLTVGLATLVNPFIREIWLGEKYVLGYDVVIALSLSFFINTINTVPSIYRTTLGYFKEAKSAPILASVLNIILSVGLAKLFGLSGIFFATAISRLFTFNVIDPYYVFKKGFDRKVSTYHLQFIGLFILLALNYILIKIAVDLIPVFGILGIIIKAGVVLILYNLVFIIMFFKTTVFKDALNTLKSFIVRKIRK